MSETNIISIVELKAGACAEADAIIGQAIRLKHRLKNAISAPLPDAETDNLIRALAEFTAASERFPR